MRKAPEIRELTIWMVSRKSGRIVVIAFPMVTPRNFPVGRSMANLQLKNSSMVQECLDNAIQWKRRAASVRDPAAKVVFTQLARCWQEIARSWREFDKSSPTT